MSEISLNYTRKTMIKLCLLVGFIGLGIKFLDIYQKADLRALEIIVLMLTFQVIMDSMQKKVEAMIPYHKIANNLSKLKV